MATDLENGVENHKQKNFVSSPANDDQATSSEDELHSHVRLTRGSRESVSLCTGTIYVRHAVTGKPVKLNAYADSCASDILMPLHVAKALGMKGQPESYKVQVHGGRTEEYTAMRSNLTLLDQDKQELEEVSVLSYQNPVEGLYMNDWTVSGKEWDHLSGVTMKAPNGKGEAEIVIGVKYAGLIAAKQPDLRGPCSDDPIARLTDLGWFIMGHTTPKPAEATSVATTALPPPPRLPSYPTTPTRRPSATAMTFR